MRVENVTRKQEIEVKEKIVKYSVGDIESLIREDLNKHDITAKDILFNTEFKYIEDEWGMNRHPVSCFKSVTVIVK